MSFSLSTSLEYHPSGLGAWNLSLEADGHLSATRRRMGEVIQFGPFLLKREENARVWGLIEQMKFPSLSSSTRMGLPDEVRYTITLQFDGTRHTFEQWHGDLQHLPSVQAVVLEIQTLVEGYTGQKTY